MCLMTQRCIKAGEKHSSAAQLLNHSNSPSRQHSNFAVAAPTIVPDAQGRDNAGERHSRTKQLHPHDSTQTRQHATVQCRTCARNRKLHPFVAHSCCTSRTRRWGLLHPVRVQCTRSLHECPRRRRSGCSCVLPSCAAF